MLRRTLGVLVAGLLLGVATWLTYKEFLSDDVVYIASETTTTTLASTTTTAVQSSTMSPPSTTTTAIRPDVPDQEADNPVEPPPWYTEAGTVSIAAPAVDIDYEVDTFDEDGTNACNRQGSPCVGRVNNFVDPEAGLVSACQPGVSLFAGHSVYSGGPDSFSNIFDDAEHDWDDGLKAGDEVIATLDDGTTCHGLVRDFDVAPEYVDEENNTFVPVSGEIMADPSDALVRFWPKPKLGRGVSRDLVEMYGQEGSYGVLMASFCNECLFPEGFYIAEDGKWHRLYNVAILVEWTHVQSTDRTPEETQ